MDHKTLVARSLAGLLSLTMLATSGGLALAAADDYASRDRVPAGVTVSGIEVGGLTPGELREAVERSVVEPLTQPFTVLAGDQTFALDPSEYLFVDVEGAVSEAYEPNRASTIAVRAVRRAAGASVNHMVEPRVEVDTEALSRTISEFASKIDSDAIDASIEITNGAVAVRPSKNGRRVVTETALEALSEALVAGEDRIELPVVPVAPSVAEEDLGKTIVVRLGSRTLELYEGTRIDRTYRVAIGKPGHSTPRGSWEITAKRYRPTWGNPGSAWAASMPARIPPGPANPLGTRAMNLNVSGIRIHGTSDVASIGRAASHGCVRMVRRDVEELYDIVEVGVPVLIVSQ